MKKEDRRLHHLPKRRTVVWIAILAFSGLIVNALYPPPTQGAVFASPMGWTVQVDGFPAHPSPPEPMNAQGRLEAVSCVADRFCEAVGQLQMNGPYAIYPLALSYRGRYWYDQATPTAPPGVKSYGENLEGISCASEVFCVAVGQIRQHAPRITPPKGVNPTLMRLLADENVSKPIIATYNGASWSLQMLSGPFWSGSLASVSCPTMGFCMAVGGGRVYAGVSGKRLQFKSAPITFTYNGSGWVLMTTPASLDKSSLNSVSCVSASFCEAVGYSSASLASALSGSTDAVITKYNGATWVVQASPARTAGSDLNGVSCVSSVFCEAVGSGRPILAIRRVRGRRMMTLGTKQALVEKYNGTSWSTQGTPAIPVAPNEFVTSLYAVSCARVTSCEAVGTWINNYVIVGPLMEGYDGKHWVIQGSPLEPPYNYKGVNYDAPRLPYYSWTFTDDVSCTGYACEAVGVIVPNKPNESLRLVGNHTALIEKHTMASNHPSRVSRHR